MASAMSNLSSTTIELQRAIIESPLDLALRHIFADACDEYCETLLAEFVRVQIALDPYLYVSEKSVADSERQHRDKLVSRNYTLWNKLFWSNHWRGIKANVINPVNYEMNFREHAAEGHRHNDSEFYYKPHIAVRNGFPWQVGCCLNWFISNAKKLFEQFPITSVVLVNCHPRLSSNAEVTDGMVYWASGDHDEDECRHYVPSQLIPILRGGTKTRSFSEARYYTDTKQAFAALDEAAVAYGRKLAGLPKLKRAS
jgi:uncharacterized protein (TIGR02996 family)